MPGTISLINGVPTVTYDDDPQSRTAFNGNYKAHGVSRPTPAWKLRGGLSVTSTPTSEDKAAPQPKRLNAPAAPQLKSSNTFSGNQSASCSNSARAQRRRSSTKRGSRASTGDTLFWEDATPVTATRKESSAFPPFEPVAEEPRGNKGEDDCGEEDDDGDSFHFGKHTPVFPEPELKDPFAMIPKRRSANRKQRGHIDSAFFPTSPKSKPRATLTREMTSPESSRPRGNLTKEALASVPAQLKTRDRQREDRSNSRSDKSDESAPSVSESAQTVDAPSGPATPRASVELATASTEEPELPQADLDEPLPTESTNIRPSTLIWNDDDGENPLDYFNFKAIADIPSHVGKTRLSALRSPANMERQRKASTFSNSSSVYSPSSPSPLPATRPQSKRKTKRVTNLRLNLDTLNSFGEESDFSTPSITPMALHTAEVVKMRRPVRNAGVVRVRMNAVSGDSLETRSASPSPTRSRAAAPGPPRVVDATDSLGNRVRSSSVATSGPRVVSVEKKRASRGRSSSLAPAAPVPPSNSFHMTEVNEHTYDDDEDDEEFDHWHAGLMRGLDRSRREANEAKDSFAHRQRYRLSQVMQRGPSIDTLDTSDSDTDYTSSSFDLSAYTDPHIRREVEIEIEIEEDADNPGSLSRNASAVEDAIFAGAGGVQRSHIAATATGSKPRKVREDSATSTQMRKLRKRIRKQLLSTNAERHGRAPAGGYTTAASAY